MKARIIYALITLGLICHIMLNVDMDTADTFMNPNDLFSVVLDTRFAHSAFTIQSLGDVDFVPPASVSITYILTEEQLEQYIQENKIPPETREVFGLHFARVVNFYDEYGSLFYQLPDVALELPYAALEFAEDGGTIEYSMRFIGPWISIYENFGGF